MSNANSINYTTKANAFHVLNMRCLMLLRYKIMTKEGVGRVSAVEMWPGAAFTRTVCTVLFLCSTHNRVKVNAKQTSVKDQVVFSVVWSRLTRVVDISQQPRKGAFLPVNWGQTLVLGYASARALSVNKRVSGTDVTCDWWGTSGFESQNDNHKVPLRTEANSCTQTTNSPSTHTRARMHTQAVLLQLPNLKREKQHELGVHQIGLKDICRWAATMSVSNGTLPEKAITVHVLN